jgi:purine-binding chemotaxis protein CheW
MMQNGHAPDGRSGMKTATAAREEVREVLVFVLGNEEYGVDILKVQEIRGYEKVTPIPSAPDYLKGVLNLRGATVPVVDMRVKFKMREVRYDSFTVVVVLRIAGRVIGLVVDAVSDVVGFGVSQVRPAPQLGSLVDGSFISGLAVQDDRVVLLLDIEKLLSTGDMNLLREASGAAP